MITENVNWRNIKIETGSGKVIFTYSDLVNLPEWPEGPLLEIINGELYMVPSPTLLHQEISLNLASMIKDFVQANQLGKIFRAPIDVVFSEEDVAIPDIVFVSINREGILTEKNINGAPDLIIEILSRTKSRDLVKKKRLYEQYGVAEYWVIDPTAQSVLIFTFNPAEEKYDEGELLTGSTIIKTSSIPQFEIPVSQIFQNP